MSAEYRVHYKFLLIYIKVDLNAFFKYNIVIFLLSGVQMNRLFLTLEFMMYSCPVKRRSILTVRNDLLIIIAEQTFIQNVKCNIYNSLKSNTQSEKCSHETLCIEVQQCISFTFYGNVLIFRATGKSWHIYALLDWKIFIVLELLASSLIMLCSLS